MQCPPICRVTGSFTGSTALPVNWLPHSRHSMTAPALHFSWEANSLWLAEFRRRTLPNGGRGEEVRAREWHCQNGR
jgi:hypothetical protein